MYHAFTWVSKEHKLCFLLPKIGIKSRDIFETFARQLGKMRRAERAIWRDTMKRMREKEKRRKRVCERERERGSKAARGETRVEEARTWRTAHDAAKPRGETARGGRGEGEKREGSANGRRATAIWQRLLWLSLRSAGKWRGATRTDRAALPPTTRHDPECGHTYLPICLPTLKPSNLQTRGQANRNISLVKKKSRKHRRNFVATALFDIRVLRFVYMIINDWPDRESFMCRHIRVKNTRICMYTRWRLFFRADVCIRITLFEKMRNNIFFFFFNEKCIVLPTINLNP